MLRFTMVGRVSDGLALAQGPRYADQDQNADCFAYKEKGEFVLEEILRGALPHSRMSVFLDRHCFHYMVENGICFMVLCDALYPKKLAFHYLQDLCTAFNEFEVGLAERIVTPYGFIKFDGIIGHIEKKYVDVRTQVNILKMNSDCFQEADVISESFSQIVTRRQKFEIFEGVTKAHLHASPIWCSKRLEVFMTTLWNKKYKVIARKWIPLGLILAVMAILMRTCLHQVFVEF